MDTTLLYLLFDQLTYFLYIILDHQDLKFNNLIDLLNIFDDLST